MSSRKASRRPRKGAASASQAASPAGHSGTTSQGDPSTGQGRLLPWLLTAVAFAGFVIALYLTLVHYRGYVSPCYVVQGCETVQTSRFSAVAGVPVALLGTVFFVTMFYLGIGLLTNPRARLVQLFKGLSFAGALAVIPLFLLQAISLRAFCSYCIATEVLMLLLWIGGLRLRSTADSSEEAAGALAGS